MAKGLIAAFWLLAAPALHAAPLIEPVDLRKPGRPAPGPGEAMIFVRFHAPGMAGDNRVTFFAWDDAANAPARDADNKPRGFRASFSYSMFGGAKNVREPRVLIVPAGSYILAGRTFNGSHTDSFCFGAPRFEVKPGEVLYLGDYEMFALSKMPDRDMRNAMRYSADPEGARAALAGLYPDLAPLLKTWSPVNGATFDCDGTEFTAYAVPGAPEHR